MASFQLVVLDAAEVTPEVIAMLELTAFFRGEADIVDMPIDRDVALDAYIGRITDETLRADYEAERSIPEGFMMEEFKALAATAIEDRLEALGEHYPFAHVAPGVLLRKPVAKITAVGASYMALQFYRALNANRVEILGENAEVVKAATKKFERDFANLFECIAGYAVSGRNAGAPYMTSTSRSAQKLHAILTAMCRRLGAGQVKALEAFSEEMEATNDGKVDCLVHTGGLPVNGATVIYLVGATMQRTAIEQKIMGPDKILLVTDFFDQRPATFHGILVRPQDEDALTLDKCKRRHCLLYTYDIIWQNMGKRDGSRYQARALFQLDRATKELLASFGDAIYQDDHDEFALEAA